MLNSNSPNNFQPPKRKSWWIVIIALILIAVPLFLLLDRGGQPQTSAPTETIGPGEVVIDNTNELRNSLLKSQYTAVYDELINYIEVKVSKTAEHAYISSGPRVQNNGNISFDVTVENPSKSFTVVIDRNLGYDKLGFIVAESNYKKILSIYKQQNEIGE